MVFGMINLWHAVLYGTCGFMAVVLGAFTWYRIDQAVLRRRSAMEVKSARSMYHVIKKRMGPNSSSLADILCNQYHERPQDARVYMLVLEFAAANLVSSGDLEGISQLFAECTCFSEEELHPMFSNLIGTDPRLASHLPIREGHLMFKDLLAPDAKE